MMLSNQADFIISRLYGRYNQGPFKGGVAGTLSRGPGPWGPVAVKDPKFVVTDKPKV